MAGRNASGIGPPSGSASSRKALPAMGPLLTKTGGTWPAMHSVAQARCDKPVPGRRTAAHLPSQISPVIRQRPSACTGGAGPGAASGAGCGGSSVASIASDPRAVAKPATRTVLPSSASEIAGQPFLAAAGQRHGAAVGRRQVQIGAGDQAAGEGLGVGEREGRLAAALREVAPRGIVGHGAQAHPQQHEGRPQHRPHAQPPGSAPAAAAGAVPADEETLCRS